MCLVNVAVKIADLYKMAKKGKSIKFSGKSKKNFVICYEITR